MTPSCTSVPILEALAKLPQLVRLHYSLDTYPVDVGCSHPWPQVLPDSVKQMFGRLAEIHYAVKQTSEWDAVISCLTPTRCTRLLCMPEYNFEFNFKSTKYRCLKPSSLINSPNLGPALTHLSLLLVKADEVVEVGHMLPSRFPMLQYLSLMFGDYDRLNVNEPAKCLTVSTAFLVR